MADPQGPEAERGHGRLGNISTGQREMPFVNQWDDIFFVFDPSQPGEEEQVDDCKEHQNLITP